MSPFFQPSVSPGLDAIGAHALESETSAVEALLARTGDIAQADTAIRARASALIANQRAIGPGSTVEAFLQSYGLSTKEGVAMMCLAEALLRIPDATTADSLIEDTFSTGNWKRHLGQSDSTLVNASTWALMLTGSVLDLDQGDSIASWFGGLIKRSGEPVIRQALRAGMKILGMQFVMGEDVPDAIKNARAEEKKGYSMSYDILGEGARTDTQAQFYVQSYLDGIRQIAASADGPSPLAGEVRRGGVPQGHSVTDGPLTSETGDTPCFSLSREGRGSDDDLFTRPGISVKLSALHPRYTITQADRVFAELMPRLKSILRVAMEHNIAVSLDAEEANRLELQLEIYQALLEDPEFQHFHGIGFVLQAYQKRAIHVAEALRALAKQHGRRLPVRLVKGAYWDSEVKYAQTMGLPGYPVFTRKEHTDLSYLACARELLADPTLIYPQFATHNALTAAAIMELAEQNGWPRDGFEFQRLHGMGESLHDQLVNPLPHRGRDRVGPRLGTALSYEGALPAAGEEPYRCRIYAPVGAHKDLLAYLIRRLLENGANSSFVHLLLDRATPIDALTTSPIGLAQLTQGEPSSLIPLPRDLYGPHRLNPEGLDFGYRSLRLPFLAEVGSHLAKLDASYSSPLAGEVSRGGVPQKQSATDSPLTPETGGIPCFSLSRKGRGGIPDTPLTDLPALLKRSEAAFKPWDATPVQTRATALRRSADLLDAHRAELIALLVVEAKKTYADAIAELREAIDFCRYYANQAEQDFRAVPLPGPTGESNVLSLHGRGVFLCISPWNFPLAIFMGQIAAALVTGNSVIAKPAEQTPRIAAFAVTLLHEAGIPKDVLQLAFGPGETIGAALVDAPHIAGVCFTGSTAVAKHINRSLAAKDGPIVPLIAETGGLNAMIVDSSALLEQAVDDILTSAFGSAGQRCSSLRMVFVQQEVAQDLHDLLTGAMDELRLGDTRDLATDIGAVIDTEAQQTLLAHCDAMKKIARWSHSVPIPSPLGGGLGRGRNEALPRLGKGPLPASPLQGEGLPTFVPPTVFGLDDPSQLTHEQFGPILHFFTYKAKQLPKILGAIRASGYGLTFGLHTRLRGGMDDILAHAPVGNRYVNRSMTGAVVGVQPFGGEGLSGTGPKAGGPHYLYRFVTERTTTINTAAIGGNVELLGG